MLQTPRTNVIHIDGDHRKFLSDPFAMEKSVNLAWFYPEGRGCVHLITVSPVPKMVFSSQPLKHHRLSPTCALPAIPVPPLCGHRLATSCTGRHPLCRLPGQFLSSAQQKILSCPNKGEVTWLCAGTAAEAKETAPLTSSASVTSSFSHEAESMVPTDEHWFKRDLLYNEVQ